MNSGISGHANIELSIAGDLYQPSQTESIEIINSIYDDNLSPYLSKEPPKEIVLDISRKKGTTDLVNPSIYYLQYSEPIDPSSSTVVTSIDNLDPSFMTHFVTSRTVAIDPTKVRYS